MTKNKFRLAVVSTHPIQYAVPLYRYIAKSGDIKINVIYECRAGVNPSFDAGFSQVVQWDVPLLDGYESHFLTHRVTSFAWRDALNWPVVRLFHSLDPNEFDAVLLHGYHPPIMLLAWIIARVRRLPIFMRSDSSSLKRRSFLKASVRMPLVKYVYSKCARFLAVGQRNKEHYLQHGVNKAKIFDSPFAVDNDVFIRGSTLTALARASLRVDLGLKADSIVIAFAGKLTKRKRPLDVLKAFELVHVKHAQVALLIIGSGELDQSLRNYLSTRSVDGVVFAGFVNQSKMPAVLGCCDVFVFPSENEPYGLALHEAACASLPLVVAADVGAAADLVLHGENGYLYTTGDVAQLAAHLIKLSVESSVRQAMGRKSLEMVQGLGYEATTEGIRSAIRSLSPQ